MLTLLLLGITIVYLLHRFLTANYGYWKSKGVPSPPVNTFLGNLRESITFKKSLGELYAEIYRNYSSSPYVGFYKIRTPGVIIRDPEIIKDILVKDFNSFQDNDIDINIKDDPLGGRNPFMLRGHRWKVTRAQLSNCFTSGKLKAMYPLIDDVSKNMVKYLRQKCDSGEDCLETKEVAAKFTTDNVASCAFGLEGRSFVDGKAEFRTLGRKIVEPSFWMGMKHLCIFLFPGLSKLISIRFVPIEAAAYLRNIVNSTLQFRQDNKIVRNDFLDSVSQLKEKPSEYGFTNEDVTAHAMSFFLDGYETSSIALSFVLYELALNTDAQDKLRSLITDAITKNDGKMSYEALQDMEYLDCVLSESLRIHPPGLFLTKRCTSAYSLPPISKVEDPVSVEVGTPIIVPVYALHHDEKYFPEPSRFDPERFSEKNKQNIVKGTYLPFGEGPRICLAQRFAILQIKIGVAAVVNNFELSVNKKTMEPIELDPRYFLMAAKGGLWLNYRKLYQ